jgi:hypothetical protein
MRALLAQGGVCSDASRLAGAIQQLRDAQEAVTGPSDPIVQSAERLCATLERIGDALVALDVETLLETEETLSQLLAAIGREHRTVDHAAIEALAERGRAALLRCRLLGSAFTSVARVRLPLHTGVETYSRDTI